MKISGFRRTHTPPKACRKWPMGPKEKYLLQRSFERYQKTEDGRYFTQSIKKMLAEGDLEIGCYEGVRFIESPIS